MTAKYLVFNHGEYDDKYGGFRDLKGMFDDFTQAEQFVCALPGGYSEIEADIWRYDCEDEPVLMADYEHRYRSKPPYWVKIQISGDGQRRECFRIIDGQWCPEIIT